MLVDVGDFRLIDRKVADIFSKQIREKSLYQRINKLGGV